MKSTLDHIRWSGQPKQLVQDQLWWVVGNHPYWVGQASQNSWCKTSCFGWWATIHIGWVAPPNMDGVWFNHPNRVVRFPIVPATFGRNFLPLYCRPLYTYYYIVNIFEIGQSGAIFQTRNEAILWPSEKSQFLQEITLPVVHETIKTTLLSILGLLLK